LLGRRSLLLEQALLVLLPATIVAVAVASNWSPAVRAVARPIWRVELPVLCALAICNAWTRRSARRARSAWQIPAIAVVIVVAALLSVGWSVDARLTVERGLSFALALGAAAAIGLGSAGDRRSVERLLVSILVAAVAVAAAGAVVLLVSRDRALQEATASIPTRYRGIGQNPNTAAMLLAAALPLASWLILMGRGPRERAVAVAAFALLLGSIVGSGSRGALILAFVGCALVAVVGLAGRARLLGTVAAAALFAACVAIMQIPQPISAAEARPSPAIEQTSGSPRDAEGVLRLQDEIGSPAAGRYQQPSRRGLFGTSGRFAAWDGAIGQVADRWLLGYGFGTEQQVFVDRYYSFYGGLPENSYIGLALQLGIVGLALLVLLALALLGSAAVAVARLAGPDRTVAAAAAAVFVVGLGLAVVQSYVYSAGNNAMLAVWTCAFLGAALLPARAAPASAADEGR
jgi:O-Antigen ligase